MPSVVSCSTQGSSWPSTCGGSHASYPHSPFVAVVVCEWLEYAGTRGWGSPGLHSTSRHVFWHSQTAPECRHDPSCLYSVPTHDTCDVMYDTTSPYTSINNRIFHSTDTAKDHSLTTLIEHTLTNNKIL